MTTSSLNRTKQKLGSSTAHFYPIDPNSLSLHHSEPIKPDYLIDLIALRKNRCITETYSRPFKLPYKFGHMQ